jgi:hypothetical protein
MITQICSSEKTLSKTLPILDGPIDSDRRIHTVVVVINGQNLLAIKSNVDECQISLWKPETTDLLVLTHKVCPLNPERKLLRGMAFNPDDRIVFSVNPYLAFE